MAASASPAAADAAAKQRKPWVIIYPVYLNARKSQDEGRRVPLAKAVENPNPTEIFDICTKALKFECVNQTDAAYPRDTMLKGRVKVKLRDDNGVPIHPTIKTKRQLLIELGTLIPRLASRQGNALTAASSGPKKKKKGGK